MQCPNCKNEITEAYANATIFFDVTDDGNMFEASTDFDMTDVCCSNCDFKLDVETSDGDMKIVK